jgi:site-specific recombinase XerD
MASVLSFGNGRFGIQFKNQSGRRPTIRLGKCDRKYASDVARRVDNMLACRLLSRPLDLETAVWLNQLSPTMRKRFAAADLVDGLPPTTLDELSSYCIRHFGTKPRTKLNLGHAADNLKTFFGAQRIIHTITTGDAEEYRKWSLTAAKQNGLNGGPAAGLADTTSSKRCKVAKQFFGFAVKKHWLLENPFDVLKGLVDSNNEREAYISESMIREVIHHITDPDLRLIVALVRFAGLRFPSEVAPLELAWINRATDEVRIYSPKTERYRGKKHRTIPLFARLRPFIDEAWDRLPDGSLHLVSIPKSATSYTKRLHRAIKRAGFEPWQKTWHNLRSSLQTELEEDGYSLMAITNWLGNTPSVAKKHYLQVTKEQFRRAVEGGGASPVQKSDAKSNASTGRNGAH